MNYCEILPAPPLTRFIECFWVLAGAGDGQQRIFPDGCTEIIINWGEPFTRVHRDGRSEKQPAGFLVGQMDGPIQVEPSRRAGVFGIRFRPGGSAAFFRQPQQELANRILSLDLLWGREFTQPIQEAATDAERVRAAERLLTSRLASPPDALVEAAVRAILSANGLVSVDHLAARLQTTRRRLERRFLNAVGLGPKRFARIARFHHALTAMERRHGQGWAEIALDTGYYDQAHFIREFKEFTGLTPSAYFPAQQPLSDFFARKHRPAT